MLHRMLPTISLLLAFVTGCGVSSTPTPSTPAAAPTAETATSEASSVPPVETATPSTPATSAASEVDSTKAAREQAVAILEQLGGKYETDPNVLGQPIIKVDLTNTKVNATGLNQLDTLKDVKWLSLNRCHETGDAELAAIADWANLEHLDLYACHKITEQGFESLGKLTKLQYLRISNTAGPAITGAGLVHFQGLTNLQKLEMGHAPNLEHRHLENLVGLNKLEELWLDHTGIGDDAVPTLKMFTHLKVLHLGNTKMSDAGVAEVQAALSNCKIHH